MKQRVQRIWIFSSCSDLVSPHQSQSGNSHYIGPEINRTNIIVHVNSKVLCVSH